MNTRILTIVGTLALLTLSSGCSGMRNFLFGRGARCGLCNKQRTPLLPRLHQNSNVPVATGATGICGLRHSAPVQAPLTYAPNYAVEPGCGRELTCGHEAGCGYETAADQCNCGGVVAGTSSYGPSNYGPVVENYAPTVNDPYNSSNIVGSYPVDGQIIGNGYPIDGQVIGNGYPVDGQIIGNGYPVDGNVIGSPVMGGTIMGDNFSPRYQSNKVDSDGAKIISEEPLPPGVQPLFQ